MAKDNDGRPILTADDWKTGKDRNKEHLKHVAELERKRAWGTVLFLGLLVVIAVVSVMYLKLTAKVTIGCLAVFSIFLYSFICSNICPKCKQRWAIKHTGERKGRGVWIFFEGEVELKCKYCGDRHWKEVKIEGEGAG